MEHPDDLLTVGEAARFLTLSENTLRYWVLTKQIPVVKVGSRRIAIRRSEVLKKIVDVPNK